MPTVEAMAGIHLPRHLASNAYIAARRCVHTVARKTVSTLFTLNASAPSLVSRGGATSLAPPSYMSRHRLILSHHYHEAAKSGLTKPRPSYGEGFTAHKKPFTLNSVTRLAEADPACKFRWGGGFQ